MVDKDAFKEIEENAWTDMEVTVMKGTIRRGMHFYPKLQSMTLETFRLRLVVGDSWGMVVSGCV